MTPKTCGTNSSGDVTDGGSTATIGPIQSEAGTDLDTGRTISGFAVCSNGGNATRCDDTAARNAGTPPNPEKLPAVINISDVGLPNSGDTLTAACTFDTSTDNA